MRVKRGVTAHRRHKKIIKQAKGFRGKRKNVFKLAKNAVMKAGQNAYRDRRLKKRTFHQLWILRINAACREHDLKYSRFIYGLELAGIEINRKMLSELAINNADVFKEIVEKAKAALPPAGEAPDLDKATKKSKTVADTAKTQGDAVETHQDASPEKVEEKAQKTESEESLPRPEVKTEDVTGKPKKSAAKKTTKKVTVKKAEKKTPAKKEEKVEIPTASSDAVGTQNFASTDEMTEDITDKPEEPKKETVA